MKTRIYNTRDTNITIIFDAALLLFVFLFIAWLEFKGATILMFIIIFLNNYWAAYVNYNIISVDDSCIEVKNVLKRTVVYNYKDIKLVEVYSGLHMPSKWGVHHFRIVLNELVKDRAEKNIVKSIKVALYTKKEMRILYEELLKRDVPCVYIEG